MPDGVNDSLCGQHWPDMPWAVAQLLAIVSTPASASLFPIPLKSLCRRPGAVGIRSERQKESLAGFATFLILSVIEHAGPRGLSGILERARKFVDIIPSIGLPVTGVLEGHDSQRIDRSKRRL